MAEFVYKVTFTDVTTDYFAGVKLDAADKDIKILTGVSTWTSIGAALSGDYNVRHFNLLYFTVDLEAGTYDKVYVNDTEHDVSAYSLPSQAAADTDENIIVELQNNAVSAIGATMYVDDVCAARNVP